MKNKKYTANNRSLSKKKITALIILVILLAVGSVFAYNRFNDTQSKSTDDTNGIDYGPPSQKDVNSAEQHKKEIDKNQSQSDTPSQPGAKKSVKPIIVSYGESDGKFEVSGRVPGIFEDSGTCTLTMTKGSARATGSSTATPNVSEMSCGFIAIPKSKLSSGSWSAKITYSSSKAHGVSDPQTVKVE
ncbi:MAG TPA: hypothetical protein VFX79_01190 [Candidatus Saccharimonadales bacterium]|nr:hypothetical protein [Candidatus Saccharimonadales bacterium]